MDGSRFDGITRALAAGQTRRQALLGVAGSALVGLLGFTQVEEAAGACVKPGKKGCKGPKNGKCCTGARCQGGTTDKVGKCVCKGSLKQCGTKCVNTKTDKTNCGSCNKRCAAGLHCTNGKCTSKRGCRAGDNICSDPTPANCPDSTNPFCFCITDVHGTPRCSDFTGGADCSTCTSNAECGQGMACFPANFGGICGDCSGNACAAATCEGIS